MRTNFIVKNTKIFFKFISRLFRNNSYYTFCKFIKCRKYVFPIERVKNDSTFLIPLWIRRVEIAYYFTLFKNKDATRFPLIAEELSLQTRRRINIVENNNLSTYFFSLNQNRAPNSFVSVENCIEYRRLSKNDTTGNASNRVLLIEEAKSAKTVKDVQVREMIV